MATKVNKEKTKAKTDEAGRGRPRRFPRDIDYAETLFMKNPERRVKVSALENFVEKKYGSRVKASKLVWALRKDRGFTIIGERNGRKITSYRIDKMPKAKARKAKRVDVTETETATVAA